MKITWYGLSSFRVRHKNRIILFDPLGKKYGLKPRSLKADVVLLSAPDKLDYNLGSYQDKSFIIDSPGEYEANEVYVIGSATKAEPDNNIYFVKMGSFGLLHLGLMQKAKSFMKVLEKLADIDILFFPIGGDVVLDFEAAIQVTNQIEPGMLIPMFYKTKGIKSFDELADEKKFLKEAGIESPRRKGELKVKKSELNPDQPQVVLLEPQ